MADSSSTSTLTPAQKLAEKHAVEDHHPTVEDAVDEEDIAHPPPSAMLSEKAAGKQKAPDSTGPKKTGLNVQSEEAFPSLGAPRAPVAAPAWSARTAASNGVNGAHNGISTSNASSRDSTPAVNTSGSTLAARGPALTGVSLPGRSTDYFDMAPFQMIPRAQLKKPIKQILDEINKKSKARVTMKEVGGNIRFEAQGPTSNDVRSALKEVASQVGSKVRLQSILHCGITIS